MGWGGNGRRKEGEGSPTAGKVSHGMKGGGGPRDFKRARGSLTGAQETPTRKGPTVAATRGRDSRRKSWLRRLRDSDLERRLEVAFFNRTPLEADVLPLAERRLEVALN